MEYQGWTLYNEVTLIIRTELTYGYKYPQAYVVDTKNKKQLETATNWGNRYNYTKDEKTGEVTKTVIPPIIKTVKNDGFTIELLDSANGSYQGGKLSFWNCLITKESDDIKCVVGINADLLLTLLLQNNFIKGKCENKVQFARKQGSVGVLTKEMVEYKEALKDMQSKKDINKKKTSKWEIGRNYKTLTMDEVYLGDIYKPLNTEYKYSRNYTRTIELDKDTYPNRMLVVSKASIENVKSLSELRDKWIKEIDGNCERIKKHSRVSVYDIVVGVGLFDHYAVRPKQKFPARQCGDYKLEIDIPLEDFFNEIIEYVQKKVIQISKERLVYIISLDKILIRTTEFNLDSLTELEKEILNIIKSDRETESLI